MDHHHEHDDEGAAASDWEAFSPKGLRVLVVDDDKLCLKVISRMLQQCNYEVITCEASGEALALLRDELQRFDLVLSDVVMPVMSYDGDTNTVLKGVTHGAVDFLIKPVRLEELRNMWQHVVRKRKQQCSDTDGHADAAAKQPSSSHSSGDAGAEARARHALEAGAGATTSEARKRPHDEQEKVLRPNGKRPRVHWSSEMHSQFVAAVNKLGIDKAVPKKILELMSVDGLTRENVASHLQKYRLYLKKAARMDGSRGGGSGSMPGSQMRSGGGGMSASQPDAPQGHVMMPGMPNMAHISAAPMGGGYGYMPGAGQWAMAAPMGAGVPAASAYVPQQQYGGMAAQTMGAAVVPQDGSQGGMTFQPMTAQHAQVPPTHQQQQGQLQQQRQAQAQQHLQVLHDPGQHSALPPLTMDTQTVGDGSRAGDDVADVLTFDGAAGFDSQNMAGVPEEMDDFLSILSRDTSKMD